MASADRQDDGLLGDAGQFIRRGVSGEESGEAGSDDAGDEAGAEAGDGADAEAGDEIREESGDGEAEDAAEDEAPKPMLEQRFSAWLFVRTTLHRQGLVVEVNRPFSQRVAAVDFDRLVFEPASVTTLRRDMLWAAAITFFAGLSLTLPPLAAWLPSWVAPALLALAALCLLAVAISPRRASMYLDREQALHPIFLRERSDEPMVAEFLEQVRRAAIAWRCRPPVRDEDDPAPRPRLADALDALQDMRQQELITDGELQRFREMAQRR